MDRGWRSKPLLTEYLTGIHKIRKAACDLIRGGPPAWSWGTLLMKVGCFCGHYRVRSGAWSLRFQGLCMNRPRGVVHRVIGLVVSRGEGVEGEGLG